MTRGRLRRAGTLLALPLKAVEELAHAIAVWPWAERIHLWVEPDSGTAGCDVALADDAPDWGLVLAAYAPMLAGALLAAFVAGVAVRFDVGPSWWAEWMLVAAAVVWWAKLTLPSPEDREVAGRE